MTEIEARSRAEASRATHGISPECGVHHAERRYIEIGAKEPDEPAPSRDLLAWVVQFTNGRAWIELALDDESGEVVRVERSR